MKVKDKINLIVVLCALCLIAFLIIFYKNDKKQMEKLESEGINNTAVIFRKHNGYKRTIYFEYRFLVDQKEYKGFINYSPSYGDISIGDSILVKYLPSDPSNFNKEIFDEKGKIKRK